jgi:bifunctional pyridoxal-dependent enzyme with beta-cystathionase and maltose regulon repressor activities
MFGIGGEQHTRLNVGTQRAVLEQAMKQLKEAIDKLR